MVRHTGAVAAGTRERRSLTDQVRQMHQFEVLLSDVSSKYIHLPFEKVESEIRNDLGRLGRLIGVDRCMFYLAGQDDVFWMQLPLCWWPEEDTAEIKNIYRTLQPEIVANYHISLKYLFDEWRKNRHVQFTHLDELPGQAKETRRLFDLYRVKSGLSVPITASGYVVGALDLTTTSAHRSWTADVITKVRLFSQLLINGLEGKPSGDALYKTVCDLHDQQKRTGAEIQYLLDDRKTHHFGNLVGQSPAIESVVQKIQQLGKTEVPVLILGETGTGKDLVAAIIHEMSCRNDRPMIKVNCAALTPSLVESELFGHERGAFTGAIAQRAGRFELAHGATLFLDEIGELPLDLQAKLLRIVQDGEFERVGGNKTMTCDARLIAATNRDLEKEVRAGRFRRDLFYRLSVFPIYISPLRERSEDIPLLVRFLVDKHQAMKGTTFKPISAKTMQRLQSYSWPGNIRELENLVARATLTSQNKMLHFDLPEQRVMPFEDRNSMKAEGDSSLEAFERRHILSVLRGTAWRINGPDGAAERLGLNPSTLRSRLKKLGIKRPV